MLPNEGVHGKHYCHRGMIVLSHCAFGDGCLELHMQLWIEACAYCVHFIYVWCRQHIEAIGWRNNAISHKYSLPIYEGMWYGFRAVSCQQGDWEHTILWRWGARYDLIAMTTFSCTCSQMQYPSSSLATLHFVAKVSFELHHCKTEWVCLCCR